VNVVDFTPLA